MTDWFRNLKQKIKDHEKISETVLLVAIFAISLFVRRIGLKFGFPLLTHHDEGYILQGVLKMTSSRTLDPGTYNRPDQVLYYLNFFFLNLMSFIKYNENVYWAFSEHYLTFYTYSRLLIAVLGSLIPVVAYKIGKEIKPNLALPSAIVFATFPLYIQHSVYITPDIPITLFTLIVIYFSLRFTNTGQQKFLVLATLFSSINTAEKYPGALSLIIVLAAAALQAFKNNDEPLNVKIKSGLINFAKIIAIYIVALFIFAPYLFINYKAVINALIFESGSVHLGADNLGWFGNMWFYARSLFANIGILGVVLSFIGLYVVIKTWDIKYAPLSYGFFYWIAMSVLALHWERWSLPMFTAPLFLIAIGIAYLLEKSWQYKIIKIALAVVIGFFIFQQGTHALYTAIRLKYTDTRVEATPYCETNGITTENTLYEGYTPLYPTYSRFIFSDFTGGVQDYQYIILSSSIFNRFYAEPERYQEEIRIYDEIRDEYVLIKEFQPYPTAVSLIDQLENISYFLKYRFGLTDEVRYSGPVLEIYQVSN